MSVTGPQAPTATHKTSVSAGAIAGGVIGGVLVIAVVTYLVWRFCIKNRKHELEDSMWHEESEHNEKGGDEFTQRRDARASTHTVGSMASTVLTRASNVIQIAYIPGVTNRSPPSTPGLLVPPVPALAFGSNSNSPISTPTYNQDQHFFMPSDLRDSTYSGINDNAGPTVRPHHASITPSLMRSSVATTIYRNNAVISPLPAQAVLRAKAAVVSVKSSGGSSPTDDPRTFTPPVPTLGSLRQRQQNLAVPGPSTINDAGAPSSPAFSVGSTFFNSADTARAVTPRPVNVVKLTRTNIPTGMTSASLSSSSPQRQKSTTDSTNAPSSHSRSQRPDASTLDDLSSDEEEEPHARSRRSLISPDRVSPITVIDDTPALHQSPFSDDERTVSPGPPERSTPQNSVDRRSSTRGHQHKKSDSMSAIIEEATKRATRQPTHGGLGSAPRESSPFDDVNEVGGRI
ncbi:MAG: hypothetical protein M1827_004215 [Pycnora praestabilis]|nr:MAG: hypothetical protein M1827_004215 [Pycnora praestabilis]